MAGGVAVVLWECRHRDVAGLMRCESCGQWSHFEAYQFTAPKTQRQKPRLRCPIDGCRKLQALPGMDDDRLSYLGCVAEGQQLPPPDWCPGFEAKQRVPIDGEEDKPRKRMKKKQRREAEQPSLF